MIDETVAEIEEMQTHSSSVVAVKAATALRELTDREFPTVEEYVRTLERNSRALRRANRSHASLHTTQQEIIDTVTDADPEDVSTAKGLTVEAIDRVVSDVEAAKDRAAQRAAEELADEDVLFTHDFSTTVLAAIEAAVDDGASFEVYVSESRPRYLGRKMARKLGAMDEVEVTLLVDAASGHYLPEADRVVVGIDCIVDETLYNRIGTYPLAATAAREDVPMTAIGGDSKFVDGAFAFENDVRSPSEVHREPADEFTVGNPAYDATPLSLLDSIITDKEIRKVS
ncbi:translation initiation factor eIF-2B [Haloarcula laminariae]|uniref:translation initiation factor eIF-2B n=1 Tax=Haloarcula laminariae TaxID=2961577 RepID=UPI0021C67FCB|nr:translation initiation factor eIF-2B [Halomicroarcula laminariae]